MKQSYFLIGCFLAFSCCNPSKKTADNNNESTMSTSGEWQSLFDGKTTKGWHKYGGGAVGSAWKVADGALYLDTAAAIQLRLFLRRP